MVEKQRTPTLGITVLGDYILNEGVEAILDNLTDVAGATAVACNPTVTAPAEEGTGSFQPPTDAGSSPRLFDRPLWGKQALWVRSGPSFTPNESLYADGAYHPRRANDLTDKHGAIIGEFVDAACDRGLKVYFQIGAVQPPGLREEDTPRLPDGSVPVDRMANTGSLASPAIRAYNRDYLRDLLDRYPRITGLRLDWPEYPCYTLGEVFQDFGPPVRDWAEEHGFDFARIRDHVGRFRDHLLGSLTNAQLEDFTGVDRGKFSLLTHLTRFPGVLDWLRMKAALSVDLLRDWRTALTEHGGADKEISAHAFMPPYSLATGFDFAGAAQVADSISPKLYTMHWAQMVQFWGAEPMRRNSGLDERLLVRALVRLMDLTDDEGGQRFADYGYPKPDEPHPISDGVQRRKIDQAIGATGHGTPVWPLVHGYGPHDDFVRRFRLVLESEADGVWINRYGYLSDEKLASVGSLGRRETIT